MMRGAFEFQGQKCSAASRAYVAKSVWKKIKDQLIADTEALSMGDVTDLSHFMGAVIDDRAFAKHKAAIARAKRNKHLTGARRRPGRRLGRLLRAARRSSSPADPTDQMFSDEYFGPILAVHVYDDADFEKVVEQMESFAPYALTGAIISQDRAAIAWAQRDAALRGRQLLRQRQADRCGRRPAAVRRRSGLGHQRQGRRRGQPAALDLAALDQGDLRAAEGPPLPPHGLRVILPSTWGAAPLRAGLVALLAFGPFVVLGIVVYVVRRRESADDDAPARPVRTRPVRTRPVRTRRVRRALT